MLKYQERQMQKNSPPKKTRLINQLQLHSEQAMFYSPLKMQLKLMWTRLPQETLQGLHLEITNRTNADDSIKANLASETNNRIDSEATIKAYLSSEISRATNFENTLASNLATETANRIDSEATIKANLNSEVSRATSAENNLSSTKEDAANKSNATSLGTSDVLFPTQKAVKTYVDAAASGNSAGLASEIINRTNADDSIKANLATETTRATSAENTLSTNLATETNNRIDSEATIKANLNDEISRATNAEATKEDAANKSTTTTLGTSDVLFPTQNAVKTYVDAASSGNSAGLASEIINRTNADDSIKANLASETNNRIDSEATIKTNLNSEISRATNSENTLTANLSTEITNRSSADATNTSNLNSEVTRATERKPPKKTSPTRVPTSQLTRLLTQNIQV